MALSAEQIFIDALGREPTTDELQDIRLNLWMLTRAGFAVDDPSNAPLIAPWAWIWARLPRPAEAHAQRAALGVEVPERSQKEAATSEGTPQEISAKIDHAALAVAIAERMPALIVRHRIDGSTFTSALRDSFTLIWVWLAAFGIGLAGVLGWQYGELHELRTVAMSTARQAEPPHHPPRVSGTPPRARHRP